MLYAFWDPLNWGDIPEFAQHRREVLAFSMAVADDDVSFVAMSYPELWDVMEEGPGWSNRSSWLTYLRARYVFRAESGGASG
ncbi:hypothetical protein K8S17_01315 [bacterium]|nr:hypothetical protein [bacterium]